MTNLLVLIVTKYIKLELGNAFIFQETAQDFKMVSLNLNLFFKLCINLKKKSVTTNKLGLLFQSQLCQHICSQKLLCCFHHSPFTFTWHLFLSKSWAVWKYYYIQNKKCIFWGIFNQCNQLQFMDWRWKKTLFLKC